MLEDRFRLKHRLNNAVRNGRVAERVIQDIERSMQRRVRRLERVPEIDVPDVLPISGHRDQLITLLQTHQVIVVSGETGSGKSTQIPKICLQAGYGVQGMICQTQPRRIAARSVAQRISDEMGSTLGDVAGYPGPF